MRSIVAGLLFFILTACTHHPVKVQCEKHLEAINPPNPVLKAAAPAKSP
jgi:hypothetical protein